MNRIPHRARVLAGFALLFVVVTIGAFVFMVATGSMVIIVE